MRKRRRGVGGAREQVARNTDKNHQKKKAQHVVDTCQQHAIRRFIRGQTMSTLFTHEFFKEYFIQCDYLLKNLGSTIFRSVLKKRWFNK
jgi:hypothetical protein